MAEARWTVSVIGAGGIGAPVIAHVGKAAHLCLGGVWTRSGSDGGTWREALALDQANIVIDAAGPGALRLYGGEVLARARLWSVGAAALGDGDLCERLTETARTSGTRLRLFSPWIAGLGQARAGDRLSVAMERPGLGPDWEGPLAEALARAPDDLNSATAAALAGPGIGATRVRLSDSGPGGAHRMSAEVRTAGAVFRSEAVFAPGPDGVHPTAAALIGALDRLAAPIGYG